MFINRNPFSDNNKNKKEDQQDQEEEQEHKEKDNNKDLNQPWKTSLEDNKEDLNQPHIITSTMVDPKYDIEWIDKNVLRLLK